PRPGPARCHAHREDAHLRRQPGQRLRGRADLPVAVHRRDGRGHRPPGHPRCAAGTGVHLPALRRPGGGGGRAVLDGAAGRVRDPGRGPADRTHPHRRRHRLPHYGRREIPPGQTQAGPRSRGKTSGRGETSSSGLKVTGTWRRRKTVTISTKGDRNDLGHWWSYPLFRAYRHSWRNDAQEGPLGHFYHWHLLAILL